MRRAQLTTFIILGLALLLIVALATLFFRSASVPEQTGGISTQQAVSYLESCLQTTAENALLTIGRQGGVADTNTLFVNEFRPWRANAIKSGPHITPYWYHVRDLDDCGGMTSCVEFRAPPLCSDDSCIFTGQYAGAPRSIQENVQDIINEKINSCIDRANLDSIDITSRGEPQAHVSFTGNDVLVRMSQPITIANRQTGERTTLESYSTRLDINFQELYLLARDVLGTQYQTQFLEENFLHFLTVYQGKPPLLPPFSDMSFLGGRTTWLRSQAQTTLEDEVIPYLNFIQIMNAHEGYSPLIHSGIDDEDYAQYVRGLYNYAEILFVDDQGNPPSYPNHGVSFFYPYMPIYLNINDGSEVLRGQEEQGTSVFMRLASVLITRYDFRYDVSWPMLVTIEDTQAFGGRGYEFTFGMQGNILRNRPVRPDMDLTTLDFEQLEIVNFDNHHEEKITTLRVIDRISQELIPDAIIDYSCGFSKGIGSTNEQGLWEGTMPYCELGGVLEVRAGFEYYPEAVRHDNVGSGTASYTLQLWPFQEKEVIVERRPIGASWPQRPPYFGGVPNLDGACGPPGPLKAVFEEMLNLTLDEDGYHIDSDEFNCQEENCTNQTSSRNFSQYALFLIERQQDGLVNDLAPLTPAMSFSAKEHTINPFDKDLFDELFSTGQISREEYDAALAQGQEGMGQVIDETLVQNISLIPGTYDVSSLLFFEGLLHMPKAKVGPRWDRETIPARNFTSWLMGGFEDLQVTFTEQDIYGDSKLVVHIPEQPLPRTWKGMREYLTIEDLMLEYPDCYGVFFE